MRIGIVLLLDQSRQKKNGLLHEYKNVLRRLAYTQVYIAVKIIQ